MAQVKNTQKKAKKEKSNEDEFDQLLEGYKNKLIKRLKTTTKGDEF